MIRAVRSPCVSRSFLSVLAVGVVCALAATGSAGAAGHTPPAARAAACPDVFIFGARGSGEDADKRLKRMGLSVFTMAARMSRKLRDDGDTTRLIGVDYSALSVDVLKPSRGQLALLPLGGAVLAGSLWWQHNVRRYLASIDAGRDELVSMVRLYAGQCQDSDVILMGYSQGAMAVHQAELALQDAGNQDLLDAVIGTILLADGDRAPGTAGHAVGAPYAYGGVGIRSYVGANRDVPDPEFTADICTSGDLVCDFNVDRLRSFSSSSRVHTGYDRTSVLLRRAVDWLYRQLSE